MKKVLTLFILFIACTKHSENNLEISTIQTFCRYYEDDLNHKGEFNISKEIKIDSLNVIKTQKQDTTIFKYKMASNILKPDTLKIIKNQLFLNKKPLKIFGSKEFVYKSGKVKIFKCDYVINNNGFPVFYNIFINDSLGIIIRRGLRQRSFVYEYGPGLDELQKKIKNDSAFFAFQ